MIDFYTWDTPNGHKIRIMLEECGLDYRIHPVNLSAGDQFAPEFLAISPNNKIPAIVDSKGPDGRPISIFESGAILLYLAEKTGRLMPDDERGRWQVMEWLMFQMSAIGPMLGQLGHFLYFTTESVPYAVERYSDEAQRLAGVVDRRLADRDFLAGDYSIADIACFPWLARHERLGIDLDELPNLQRWIETIAYAPPSSAASNRWRQPPADPSAPPRSGPREPQKEIGNRTRSPVDPSQLQAGAPAARNHRPRFPENRVFAGGFMNRARPGRT